MSNNYYYRVTVPNAGPSLGVLHRCSDVSTFSVSVGVPTTDATASSLGAISDNDFSYDFNRHYDATDVPPAIGSDVESIFESELSTSDPDARVVIDHPGSFGSRADSNRLYKPTDGTGQSEH